VGVIGLFFAQADCVPRAKPSAHNHKQLAPNRKQAKERMTTSSGLAAGGVDVTQKPFEYDAELMQKARWIIEQGLHRPSRHEIERQLEMPLPMPPREPETGRGHN
jgi:hypothetical protein